MKKSETAKIVADMEEGGTVQFITASRSEYQRILAVVSLANGCGYEVYMKRTGRNTYSVEKITNGDRENFLVLTRAKSVRGGSTISS